MNEIPREIRWEDTVRARLRKRRLFLGLSLVEAARPPLHRKEFITGLETGRHQLAAHQIAWCAHRYGMPFPVLLDEKDPSDQPRTPLDVPLLDREQVRRRIGRNVYALRTERGWSTIDAGARMGVDSSGVIRLENGIHPDRRTLLLPLARLCFSANVPVSYLFTESEVSR